MASADGPTNVISASRQAAAKRGVLRQKAVAGVDRLGARLFCGFEQGFYVQVALPRRWRADVDGFVGVAGVECLGVGVGVDGDSRYLELLTGPYDAQRDLTAVGDQNLLQHDVSASLEPHLTRASWYPARSLALHYQIREAAMAGAAATATSAARATFIRSKITKGATPCARATAMGSLVTTASQVAPKA